jgi:hypothetical protein
MSTQYQKDMNDLIETAMMHYANAKELGAFRGYVQRNFRGNINWPWLDMMIRKLAEEELMQCNDAIVRVLGNQTGVNDASDIPF